MKKLRSLLYFLNIAFLIISSDRPSYPAKGKPAVAVFDFAALGAESEGDSSPSKGLSLPVGDALGRMVAHNINRSLSQVKEVALIDRSHWTVAQSVTTSQRIRPASLEDIKGVSDSLTASDLGRLLGADVTITGQIQASASEATIIAQAIRAGSGEVMGVEEIKVTEAKDIPYRAEELSRRLLAYILPAGEVLKVEKDRTGGEVEISFYSWVQAKSGDRYMIVRPGEEIKDPRTGETLALADRTVAQLSLVEVRRASSLASILNLSDGEAIQAGDEVWPFEGPRGYLSVSSSPSRASVYVGDRLLSLTPLKIIRVASGNYRLRVVKEGYKDHSQEIVIVDRELLSVEPALEPNWGNLEVSSEPAGAEVYIDGRLRGLSPGLIEGVVVGSRKVRLVAKGYEDWIGMVDVELGRTTQLAATLTVMRRSDLTVESFPSGGEVYVNGEIKGPTPLSLKNMRIGSYAIRITKNYFQDWEGEAEVAENQQNSIKAELVYSDPTLIDDFESAAETVPSGKGAWKVLKDAASLASFRQTSSVQTPDGSRGVGRWSYEFPSDNRPHYSGIEVTFGGVRPEDWSNYQGISLDIRAEVPSGPFSAASDIWVKAFLHDPNVTAPSKQETWKIVVAKGFIKPEAAWRKVEVPFSAFGIDEGWLSDHRRSFWENLIGSDKKEASTSVEWSKVYGLLLSVEAASGRNTILIDNMRLTLPATASGRATEG